MALAASELEAQPGEVYLSAADISARVSALGADISRDFAERSPVLVTVLRSAFVFVADLSRALRIPHRLDFVAVSAYRGARRGSAGRIRLLKDLDLPVTGDHVILVEDIVDTGLTLNYLLKTLRLRDPASLTVCSLLDRPQRRLVDIDVRYAGFTATDRFVVGYGFDYRGRFRMLPDIHLLERP